MAFETELKSCDLLLDTLDKILTTFHKIQMVIYIGKLRYLSRICAYIIQV